MGFIVKPQFLLIAINYRFKLTITIGQSKSEGIQFSRRRAAFYRCSFMFKPIGLFHCLSNLFSGIASSIGDPRIQIPFMIPTEYHFAMNLK